MYKHWTEIRFIRGAQDFRTAWQHNAGAFLQPDEEMRIAPHAALTNMPRKHIRAFLRQCAPKVRVNLFIADEPED